VEVRIVASVPGRTVPADQRNTPDRWGAGVWSARGDLPTYKPEARTICYLANTKKALERALPPPATMSMNDMPD